MHDYLSKFTSYTDFYKFCQKGFSAILVKCTPQYLKKNYIGEFSIPTKKKQPNHLKHSTSVTLLVRWQEGHLTWHLAAVISMVLWQTYGDLA